MIRGTVDRERLWPFLENFAARSHGQMTADDFWNDIEAREKQAYVVNDWQAVFVTSLHEEHIYMHGCAGERSDEWRGEVDDFMRAWARATGKKRLIGMVRPGWVRWAKTRGYMEAHRELILEV